MALAITGCIRGTSSEKLYNELCLMSLHDRRTFHRLVHFYKIENNLAPNYLRKLIPESRTQCYNHRTHISTTFPTLTRTFQYCFFPHCVNMVENLNKVITKSSSLGIFKKRNSDFFVVKSNSMFNVHKPIGLKYLTRLRVGFSHLI